MGYYTGARKSELLKRRWTDVDLEAKTIIFRNTKNGEDRILPLIPEALAPPESMTRVASEGGVCFPASER